MVEPFRPWRALPGQRVQPGLKGRKLNRTRTHLRGAWFKNIFSFYFEFSSTKYCFTGSTFLFLHFQILCTKQNITRAELQTKLLFRRAHNWQRYSRDISPFLQYSTAIGSMSFHATLWVCAVSWLLGSQARAFKAAFISGLAITDSWNKLWTCTLFVWMDTDCQGDMQCLGPNMTFYFSCLCGKRALLYLFFTKSDLLGTQWNPLPLL